jgi:hypothetical protein
MQKIKVDSVFHYVKISVVNRFNRPLKTTHNVALVALVAIVADVSLVSEGIYDRDPSC